jgi:hypothetical protein
MSGRSGILPELGMGYSKDKPFSANLLSPQLQLRTLLEEPGGDGAVRLLDALCKVTPSEQKIILGIFTATIDRIVSGELRLENADDRQRKELEENLYGEIMNSIERAAAAPPKKRMEVLDGGKCPPRHFGGGVLDLDKLRKARKSGFKLLSN